MEFTKELAKIPDKIGKIVISIIDYPAKGDRDTEQFIQYSLDILDSDGMKFSERNGDLTPYISPEDAQTLKNILSTVRIASEKIVA